MSTIASRTSVVRCTLDFVGLRGRPYKGRPDDLARQLRPAVLREEPPGNASPSQGIQEVWCGGKGCRCRAVGGRHKPGRRRGAGGPSRLAIRRLGCWLFVFGSSFLLGRRLAAAGLTADADAALGSSMWLLLLLLVFILTDYTFQNINYSTNIPLPCSRLFAWCCKCFIGLIDTHFMRPHTLGLF